MNIVLFMESIEIFANNLCYNNYYLLLFLYNCQNMSNRGGSGKDLQEGKWPRLKLKSQKKTNIVRSTIDCIINNELQSEFISTSTRLIYLLSYYNLIGCLNERLVELRPFR